MPRLQLFDHIKRRAAAQPLFRVHFADGEKRDIRAESAAAVLAHFKLRGISKIKRVREDDPRLVIDKTAQPSHRLMAAGHPAPRPEPSEATGVRTEE